MLRTGLLGQRREVLAVAAGLGVFLATGVSVIALHQRKNADRELVARLPVIAGNPVVYLDIANNGVPLGRLTVHLRKDTAPRAAENFRALCTGERGFGYRASALFAIEKHVRVCGGDFFGTGQNGYSIFGDTFEDEDLTSLTHLGPGTLAMRSAGPNTNNSQFYITLARAPQFNGEFQVVGYLLDGFDVLERLDKLCTSTSVRFPAGNDVRVAACGEMTASEVAAALAARIQGQKLQ